MTNLLVAGGILLIAVIFLVLEIVFESTIGVVFHKVGVFKEEVDIFSAFRRGVIPGLMILLAAVIGVLEAVLHDPSEAQTFVPVGYVLGVFFLALVLSHRAKRALLQAGADTASLRRHLVFPAVLWLLLPSVLLAVHYWYRHT